MAPMIVMGLFGFIGKAVKGVGKLVGGAVKVGLGAATLASKLGLPIPGGGLVGKIAGSLLAAKRPMSSPKTAGVITAYPTLLRAKSPMTIVAGRMLSTPRLQQMSPVLPGGAIATRAGPTAATAHPPLSFSGAASPTRKRKRKSSSRARSTTKRKRRGRKLKFGSPAWRKKYMRKGRKRRRRAA